MNDKHPLPMVRNDQPHALPGPASTSSVVRAEEYTQAKMEFLMAVGEFTWANDNTFPTWQQVFEIFMGLGYRKEPAGKGQAGTRPDRCGATQPTLPPASQRG